MRRRISYANVAATLALVFSMSGGALAASHYLINSTKQINPKLLKKLKGATGPRGAAGLTGAAGANGAPGAAGKEGKEGSAGKEGKEGKEGAAPATLPTGHSESGTYAVAGGKEGFMAQGFAFPLPLASALDESHAAFLSKGTTSGNCPGVGKAAPGFLCVYEAQGVEDKPDNGHAVNTHAGFGGADAGGFMLFFDVKENGFSYGSWTATGA